MNRRRDSNPQSSAFSSLSAELLHSNGSRRPMPYPLGHGGSYMCLGTTCTLTTINLGFGCSISPSGNKCAGYKKLIS